jgi:phosphate starvation-inducible PhoH-like protein
MEPVIPYRGLEKYMNENHLKESEMGTYSQTMVVSDQDIMERLAGNNDENFRVIEERFPVRLVVRGEQITVQGPDNDVVQTVFRYLEELFKVAKQGHQILVADVRYGMDMIAVEGKADLAPLYNDVICTTARGKPVRPKTGGQKLYIEAMRAHDIVFAIGPAGTGKTYLAVCHGVAMLKAGAISRIVLVRPAVEAGESLGYLPGDLREKVEPYVRPLYDAFYDLFSPERFLRYIDKNVIEIAPLAYMRGRTLNDSFIILDEAQNTTREQMKMFLTRLGFGSKAVVTGDITQIDLPSGKKSGLIQVREILEGIKGIAFLELTNRDVVRHEIVQRVVRAYEEYENRKQ